MATWQSLLCQDGWVYPTTYGNWIVFNEDSTGELHCGVGPSSFICAEFIWKPVGDTSAAVLQQPVDHEKVAIDIELTLSKRRPERGYETTLPDLNEVNLTTAAFQPKTYKLQMETGKFTVDKWFCFNSPPNSAESNSGAEGIETCYDLRVVFDKSPYPPLEEWVEQKNSVDKVIRMHKFWEFRDFYRDSSEA